jgi:hypothetical protein
MTSFLHFSEAIVSMSLRYLFGHLLNNMLVLKHFGFSILENNYLSFTFEGDDLLALQLNHKFYK